VIPIPPERLGAGWARAWTRGLKGAMVLVAGASFLILWQIRVPEPSHPPRNGAFVHLGAPGGVLAQQSDLLDPAALFLPGPMNHGERLLEAVRPAGRRELYGAFPGAPILGDGGVAGLAVERAKVPAAEALTAPAPEYYLAAIGRTMPPQPTPAKIEVSLRQLDGVQERRLSLEPGQEGSVDGTRFARFLIRVADGRTIGDPFFLDGGGDAGTNLRASALAREAVARAHPIASGLWELALTW
jgi:hypothetical protein